MWKQNDLKVSSNNKSGQNKGSVTKKINEYYKYYSLSHAQYYDRI